MTDTGAIWIRKLRPEYVPHVPAAAARKPTTMSTSGPGVVVSANIFLLSRGWRLKTPGGKDYLPSGEGE
jgi:hypothetical protein